MNVNDKVAVVTVGASGIARRTRLSHEGTHVVLSDLLGQQACDRHAAPIGAG